MLDNTIDIVSFIILSHILFIQNMNMKYNIFLFLHFIHSVCVRVQTLQMFLTVPLSSQVTGKYKQHRAVAQSTSSVGS